MFGFIFIFVFSIINMVYSVSLIYDKGPHGDFYKSPLYLKIKEKINFIGPSEKSFTDYLAEPYEGSSRYDQLEEEQKNTLYHLVLSFDNLNEQAQFSIKCTCAAHENDDIEELRNILFSIFQEVGVL